MMMLLTACAINQSSDSQDLGRYLGFRLRCLDVETSTSRPHPPPPAGVPPMFDVTAHLTDCPLDGGPSPLQSPAGGPVSRSTPPGGPLSLAPPGGGSVSRGSPVGGHVSRGTPPGGLYRSVHHQEDLYR